MQEMGIVCLENKNVIFHIEANLVFVVVYVKKNDFTREMISSPVLYRIPGEINPAINSGV